MKLLYLLVFVFLTLTSHATNYYISNSGNDGNNGTDPSTPWKTIDKVNSYNGFKAGDQILFNRGDVFYGTLKINASDLTFETYGTGMDPEITGFTQLNNWKNLGGNIWETTASISSLSSCNVVVINGANTAKGRFPNSGYLTISNISSGSLSSSSLNSSSLNWTGAEVVIKKERWIIDRKTIKSASGNSLSYSTSPYIGRAGWGFFIQDDPRTLDIQNEWYFDPSTKKLRIYSVSEPSNVKISTLDNLVYLTGKTGIVINGLRFSGANLDAFYLGAINNTTIKNCSFDFNYNSVTGYQFGSSSANFVMENCSINHTNNNAVSLPSEFGGAKIIKNVIKNSGILPGMSGSGDGQAQGLNVAGNSYLIQYNEIDSTGYVPLGFNGSNIICDKNFVNTYCLVKDDGGGIYTGNPQTGVVISNNIVINGVGCDDGTGSTNNGKASGIYCDDNSSGMSIVNNSIASAIYGAIFIHNGNNIRIEGNTTFNCGIGLLVDNDNIESFTRGIMVYANFFVANTTGSKFTPQDQVCLSFKTAHTSGNDITNFGSADSNFYARPLDDNLTILGTVYGSLDNYYSLSSWKSYFGNDKNSNKSPKAITNTSDLVFVYNSTTSNKTIGLNSNYIDLSGKSHNGGVSLEPFTSMVLIKDGSVIENLPPKANAGPDQTITLPENKISLQGSGSDTDGQIIAYAWSKISGPDSTIIKNPDSSSVNISNLQQGSYLFELQVTDDKGSVGKDTIAIKVENAPNVSPTADAGSDQTITSPLDSVILVGNGKVANGSIPVYKWSKISGVSSRIMEPDSAVTKIADLTAGVYLFKLTVTDDKGATASDTVSITVKKNNISPIANAGDDQVITLPINSITLSGSATDSDGTVASYSWTEKNGPQSAKLNSPSSANTTVEGLIEGDYTFQLTVTDNEGATGSDTIHVRVNPPVNATPTAIAGNNKTIVLPLDSVTLKGVGQDTDGRITSYLWTKISGPAGSKIHSSAAATTLVSGLVQGIYQFKLQVTDNEGAIGKDTVRITVNAGNNIPPTANAGADQTITLPAESVSLAGSGNDSDGTIKSYSWTKFSGPAGAQITNSDSANTSVTNLVQGVYQFVLTVTDDKGDVGTDTAVIKVNSAQNQAPVAHAGNDQTIMLPTNSVTLSGTGIDGDGTIASYKWTQSSGPSSANISKSAAASTKVTGLKEGVYVFKLTVTDDKGATATSTTEVTVNLAGSDNVAPTANAGTDQSITLPSNSIMLSGNGSDPDGSITSYQWKKISGPTDFSITNSSSQVANVTGLVKGEYVFELTVTDNKGAKGTSTVTVTVNEPANIQPTANAGADQSVNLPLNNATLRGEGNDVDGTVVGYSWIQISGPSTGTINNPNSPSTVVSNLVEGNYMFELQVEDNRGGIGKDTMVISVNSTSNTTTNTTTGIENTSNLLPVANAGNDTTVIAPVQSVTLNGSGIDKDGNISGYSWRQISGPSASTILSDKSAMTNISGLSEGTYSFELAVTDNKGGIGKDTVNVTVALARYAPSKVKAVNIYPNPVHDIATLEVNTGTPNTNIGIVIVDISGRTVYQKEFVSSSTESTVQINMSNLIKGTYFVSVYFDETKVQTVKVLKL